MSAVFDSLVNRGEYLSAHYVAEHLTDDLRKGILATWTTRESDDNDPRTTPRQRLRALRRGYVGEQVRGFFVAAGEADTEDEARLRTHGDPDWGKRLREWHQDVLRALGYDPAPREVTVHRAGREHTIQVAFHGEGIIAVDCGWATDPDAALTPDGPGRLLSPLQVSGRESYETGAALATWLFQS